MPTKTSPYNQPIPRMNTRPAQIIDTVNKMPGLATDASAAAAAGGLAKAIPGVNLALLGILSSVGLGDLYTPKGIKERQASEKAFAEATSNVNDQLAKNLAAQKSNVTMKEENEDMPPMTMAPLKQLSPYTASYSAYNMSAKQASMEPVMQKLSGVSSLQFTDEGLEKLSAANIGGEFGAIVEAEKNKREENK